MLKKILFTVFCISSLAFAAGIDDGPFPMQAAMGVWRSESGFNVHLEQAGGKQSKTVDVRIELRDEENNLLGVGVGRHYLQQHDLVVWVRGEDCRYKVTMQAVYPHGYEPNSTDFYLKMEVKKVGDEEEPFSAFFNMFRF